MTGDLTADRFYLTGADGQLYANQDGNVLGSVSVDKPFHYANLHAGQSLMGTLDQSCPVCQAPAGRPCRWRDSWWRRWPRRPHIHLTRARLAENPRARPEVF